MLIYFGFYVCRSNLLGLGGIQVARAGVSVLFVLIFVHQQKIEANFALFMEAEIFAVVQGVVCDQRKRKIIYEDAGIEEAHSLSI